MTPSSGLTRFYLLLAFATVTLTGCGSTPTKLDSPPSGNDSSAQPILPKEDLALIFAKALAKEYASGCDIALTAAYYRELTNPWEMQDLNNDGVAEAICRGDVAIYEPGEQSVIAGAGGGPAWVYQLIDGRWQQIADLHGKAYEISAKSINEWKILVSHWHMGGYELTSTVHVYESG